MKLAVDSDCLHRCHVLFLKQGTGIQQCTKNGTQSASLAPSTRSWTIQVLRLLLISTSSDGTPTKSDWILKFSNRICASLSRLLFQFRRVFVTRIVNENLLTLLVRDDFARDPFY
jgi:hypothetical protein